MVLPTSPPASMSVSQILAEFGITAGTTKRISTDLFPLVGGTAGSQCFLGASFSGKSTGMLLAYSYIIGGTIYYNITDSSQNMYVTGTYNSATTVPINTFSTAPSASGFSLPVTTGSDGFVIKWNANGTVGGYTTIKGTSSDACTTIKSESQNIYVTGTYVSTATVPINTLSTAPSASGFSLPVTAGLNLNDMFIIKWNANGTVGGYTTLRGTSGDAAYSLRVDSSQNIYAVGFYNSTATVPINTFSTASSASGFSLPVTTGTHSFVIKWNGSNGTVGGYTTIRGSTNESIVLDSSQNIYVTGFYNSATTVPINTFSTAPSASGFSLPVTTGTDSFVIKWNANGTVGGYTTIKGTSSDACTTIKSESQNIYVTGTYVSTATVPINTLSTAPSASGFSLPVTAGLNLNDMFIIKWNANGTVGGYTTLRGTSGDAAYSLRVDSSQNIYAVGFYNSTATVPINTFSTASSASGFSLPAASTGSDMFVIKWNGSNGTVGGYTTLKGTGGDITFIINRDSSQNIYAGGSYSSTATVPINTLSTASSASGFSLPVTTGSDGFVIKWNANGTVGGYTTLKGTGGDGAYSLEFDSSQNKYVSGAYVSTATVPINTFSTAPSASGFSLPAASTGGGFIIKWNA